ncbi:hypothetical protein Taro_025226 [Colocasia esculenta]|uniref:Pectinesterase inhibitor domain-containing protein n=1 Tax=Colocasia esculenta TaxID=4460 RepID=A0A843VBP3_COLES|nr:hypothetical protein [Colocasia esculenta]
MATTAKGIVFLLALVANVAGVWLHITPVGAATGAPEGKSTEFIRRSCSSTLYPALCYASLASYASAVAQDPTQLALVAANVSLARVRSVSFHVSNLRRIAVVRKLEPRSVSTLQDCLDNLDDAGDLTQQAAAELRLLLTAEGPYIAWRVSNAQTWLSAALTNEDTCADGFAAMAPGAGAASPGGGAPRMKADVCGRVRQAKEYTSNALALVNVLVGMRR